MERTLKEVLIPAKIQYIYIFNLSFNNLPSGLTAVVTAYHLVLCHHLPL